MPTLRTKYVALGAGVYICRRGDAIHIVTTGDNNRPTPARSAWTTGPAAASEVMAKSNWISEQEVSVEQFRDVVATVAPTTAACW
jgi:hypothetical protein